MNIVTDLSIVPNSFASVFLKSLIKLISSFCDNEDIKFASFKPLIILRDSSPYPALANCLALYNSADLKSVNGFLETSDVSLFINFNFLLALAISSVSFSNFAVFNIFCKLLATICWSLRILSFKAVCLVMNCVSLANSLSSMSLSNFCKSKGLIPAFIASGFILLISSPFNLLPNTFLSKKLGSCSGPYLNVVGVTSSFKTSCSN